jgi:hypothetical protein
VATSSDTEAEPGQAAAIVRATKLISEGRLKILAVRGDTSVLAHVGGSDGSVYQVVRKADGRMICPCDASRWNLPDCVHRAAVRLVT